MTRPDSQDDAASEPVLVSACLMGVRCRYDGRANEDSELARHLAGSGMKAVPFCPEEQGGLGTPRPAAWIEDTDAAAVVDGAARVVSETGEDVSDAFLSGARAALATCQAQGIRRAFLKERSPSCGTTQTHVDGQLTAGPGVTTEVLRRGGVRVEGIEGRRE
ncbi:MAG: hypothetical protein ACI8QZ_002233 [Chlamydiales bacterium]|jgi:uncharacterized protein YbbK (DUF523 family)